MSFIPKPDEAHSTPTAKDIAPALRDELKLFDGSRAHLTARIGTNGDSPLSSNALVEFENLITLIRQTREKMDGFLSFVPKAEKGDGARDGN